MAGRIPHFSLTVAMAGSLATLTGLALSGSITAAEVRPDSPAREAASPANRHVPSAVTQFTARSRAAARRQGQPGVSLTSAPVSSETVPTDRPVAVTAADTQSETRSGAETSVSQTTAEISASDSQEVVRTADATDTGRREPDATGDSGEAPLPTEVEQTRTGELPAVSTAPLIPPAPSASPESPPSDSQDVPLEPSGVPIDLGSALALVAGQNPQVGFAQARVREAYARLDAAELLWVPDLQAGINYHRHDGNLQDVGGKIVDINRSSLNAGLGAGATGAGTIPYPGVVLDVDAADAVFAPEIARRTAWASRHAAAAELNDQLLEVAVAYLELTAASQRILIARETLTNAEDLARRTADFARTGQGLQADAERAAVELRLRRNELLRAEEEAAVASARLAQRLRLDPTTPLCPAEIVPVPIELVAADCEARLLVAEALGRRPELREQRALVEEARLRLRQEKYAPLLPSVLIGASYGGFGGGIGDQVGSFHDRADFDAVAVWEVRNLGFGERAARNVATARVDQSRFRQIQTMDEIAREVVEAQAQTSSRRRQVTVAEEAIVAATASYRLNRQRIAEAQGLPIEVLQALQSLDATRRDHVRAVTDYNVAQFRLHRALGWPAP